jgi:hypothetical protein
MSLFISTTFHYASSLFVALTFTMSLLHQDTCFFVFLGTFHYFFILSTFCFYFVSFCNKHHKVPKMCFACTTFATVNPSTRFHDLMIFGHLNLEFAINFDFGEMHSISFDEASNNNRYVLELMVNAFILPSYNIFSIVMTFLVRECYGSPKKHKNSLKFAPKNVLTRC